MQGTEQAHNCSNPSKSILHALMCLLAIRSTAHLSDEYIRKLQALGSCFTLSDTG